MDLPVTTQMLTQFNLAEVDVLHIEPTTVCNAQCPQCDRQNPDLYNDDLQTELSLQEIKEVVSDDFIKKLRKMYMCGNFGDPAASKECLNIFRYFREINPNIELGMNTNGGLRDTNWWKQLAEILTGPLDYVVFSIDGLEDTNHIYRKKVNWNKLMQNVNAYISAGGIAHWDMLVFDHNQHQIKLAESIAKQLGFTWFRSKVSKRFSTMPVKFIDPPKDFDLPTIDNNTQIHCYALKEKSVFLSVKGFFLPCCFIGPYAFDFDQELSEALNTPHWKGVSDRWDSAPLPICKQSCALTKQGKSNFEQQWRKEVALK